MICSIELTNIRTFSDYIHIYTLKDVIGERHGLDKIKV